MHTARLVHHKNAPHIRYVRQELQMADGGCTALDWNSFKLNFVFRATDAEGMHDEPDTVKAVDDFVVEAQKGTEEDPTLVVLHGLTGGSHESYIRTLLHDAQQKGFRAVVINARGCGGTPLKTQQFFCAAWTEDVRHAVRLIHRLLPKSPLIGVGFSMGSNVLVKYLGEEGAATPLKAAISIGNPWDLWEASQQLRRPLYKHVYNKALARSLVALLKLHSHVLKDNNSVNLHRVYRSQTVYDFDERFTSVIFGYRTVKHYYSDASAWAYLANVRVPILCCNSFDDPVCSSKSIPFPDARVNDKVILVTTRRGGHLGWFQGLGATTQWVNDLACEYVEAMLHLIHQYQDPALPVSKLEDKSED
eukprot:CAMPEP_0196663690 /NCGR_PEP_ID=MMETSP1086-20130531/53844_1 /TAXON_ID=77921 /ORGANISM="Cyanoptyche  gloeocystis , Strain SAG4.97" /LENGTH=361 /DNA_ID=CAMNT_0041999605 /DNA_START=282 /DNA_END=1367 /DNA_ORIENTATION=+